MLNPCDTTFVTSLAARLPQGCLIAPEPRHLEEPRGRWRGQAGIVARPQTTADVAVIVAACHAARVGIVPWGGGTGLVGGQVQPAGPVPLLLSLERMTRLRGAYPQESALVVEAGMILADVQAEAARSGLERVFDVDIDDADATVTALVEAARIGAQPHRPGAAEAAWIEGHTPHGLLTRLLDASRHD